MKVKIQLFANLGDYGVSGEKEFELDIPDNATAGWLIQHLKIPSVVEKVVLVNGRHANEDVSLSHDDRIAIFPPMPGG